MPPVLAGRDEEIKAITKTLARIAGLREESDGRPPRQPLAPIKLVGPRGAGKTTLLGRASAEAKQRKIHVVRCAFLKEYQGFDGFDNLIEKMLGDFEIEGDVSARLGMKYAELKATAHVSKRKAYNRVLQGLLAKKPVLFLFDEAVHYDQGLLALLLQENQELMNEGLPLAMIIAGTPALDDFLSDVDATFINRSQQIYIHQLSDEAVRDALRKPFVDNSCQITDDALELMAGWTDNYPYFIQLAGEAAWDAMIDAKRVDVDKSLAQAAEPAMQKMRDDYYRSLYLDLDKAKLLGHADHMIGIIENAEQPLVIEEARHRLEQVAGIDADSSYAACHQMQDLNLLWLAENDDVGPAIPSFFSYFKTRYARGKNQEG